ncbi:hypothetical protein ACFE04_006210 [Oxalis oulophora]
MEYFKKAKTVRLRSYHDKYLIAGDDQESVFQDRNGSLENARWTVEYLEYANTIRLKSCYGKYLTASDTLFLIGRTGKKVFQTSPIKFDSSLEWGPERDGVLVKLKTSDTRFLRANRGLPPWRNSVTHDVLHIHRGWGQDWILWDVEVVVKATDENPNIPETNPIIPDEPISPLCVSNFTAESPLLSS